MPRATSVIKMKGSLSALELEQRLSILYPRFPSKVTAIQIPSARPPLSTEIKSVEKYTQAFKKNESLQHSYLKWFGLKWCLGDCFEQASNSYFYESRIAYPDQLEPALAAEGNIEIVGQGVILPRGELYSTQGCQIKVADVYGDINIVECGDTDPSSLVLPLAARIVKNVVWIPHQHKDIKIAWPDFSIQCEAFLIEHQNGFCKPPKRSNLYTMRTVGNHYFLGDRNYQIVSDEPITLKISRSV